MKVVLDTNILVSGLLTPFGTSGEIIRMVSGGKLILQYDSRILLEYQEVLYRSKFKFNKDQINSLIDYIKKNGQAVPTSPLNKRLPDPDDAPFLEAAIGGEAEYLVTGNKVHYPRKFTERIKIVSPIEFVNFYRKIKDNTEPQL
ncbi:putative toxin-antitoxin system toxin component, PIN family [Thermodesulfobacteriota bacterium]